jgi:transcriptional regulator with XRE-family HTH domain
MGLPERIQALIVQKGLVRRSVAANAGFSEQQLCDMLHGRKRILADYIPRLARALGVEIREIFMEEIMPVRGGTGMIRLVIDSGDVGETRDCDSVDEVLQRIRTACGPSVSSVRVYIDAAAGPTSQSRKDQSLSHFTTASSR